MKKLFTLALMCMLAICGYSQDPGTFDESFGTNGIATFNPSSRFDFIKAVLVQEDGKIITVGEGQTEGTNYAVFVSRQNPDGSLDPTWGANGGISYYKADPMVYKNEAYDAKIGPDGMLYIAGHIYDSSNGDSRGFVLCVDENGFENVTYGDNGYAISESGNGINYTGIAIDSYGRCIVSGYTQHEADTMFVRRYNTAGLKDPSFGDNGTLKIAPHASFSSYGYAVECVESNKIIVGGTRLDTVWGCTRATLYKVKNNGSLDTSFGTNGYVELNVGEGAEQLLDIEVDPNGNYLCAGHSWLENEPYLRYETYVTRITPNGTIDTSFGTNGYARLEPLENGANDCYGITVAHDGQIFGAVTAELWYDQSLQAMRIYAFNLTADGQLNEDFAGTGYLPYSLSYPEIYLREVAMQKDGKLIAGGYTYDGNINTEMMISRIYTSVEGTEPGDPSNPAGIEVVAEAIDANNVKVTATPNAYAVEYHVGIISKTMFDQVGVETFAQALQADGNPHTEAQEISFGGLTELTEYVVIATAKNAEEEWTTVTANVTTPQGEGCEEIMAAKFNVYPNPATSVVYIESVMNETAQVSIVDLTGRCVKQIETTGNVSTIAIDDMNNGVYFVMIEQGGSRMVQKLVVK